MSTREHLNRIRRRAVSLAIPGFVLAVAGMALSHGRMPYAAFGIGGIILFMLGGLVTLFTGRCLQCHRRLGQMFSQHSGVPWRIAPELRFCPYCGHPLDEPSSQEHGKPG